MRRVCQYSIVKFMPFIETGEFANVGVVLLCDDARYFGFKMLKRYGRVTRFFENIDAHVYTEACKYFHEELTRIRSLLKSGQVDGRRRHVEMSVAHQLFEQLVRPREVLMRLEAPRAVLAADPKAKLEELYSFYVERDFATKQYQERLLEKGIRRLLFQENLGNEFTERRIGNDDFHVRFPFVHVKDDQPIKVIKPFYLAHEEPTKILDHGGRWVDRIRRLKRRGLLPPHVLFAIEEPELGQDSRMEACREICNDLTDQGVVVAAVAEQSRILQFATA